MSHCDKKNEAYISRSMFLGLFQWVIRKILMEKVLFKQRLRDVREYVIYVRGRSFQQMQTIWGNRDEEDCGRSWIRLRDQDFCIAPVPCHYSMLRLRCLLDIQVELSSTQVNIKFEVHRQGMEKRYIILSNIGF